MGECTPGLVGSTAFTSRGGSMRRKYFQFICKIVPITIWVLAGCQHSTPAGDAPLLTNTIVATMISTSPATKGIDPMTPTSTQIQKTVVPTETRSAQTPFPTKIPTLSELQTSEMIVDLLQNNAGCELPCIWGFTPGKTSWEIALKDLRSIGSTIRTEKGTGGELFWTRFMIPENNLNVGISFVVNEGLIRIVSLGANIYRGDYTIVDDPIYPVQMERYIYSNVLTTYGKPTEASILVWPGIEPNVTPDYYVRLIYPDRGFMVFYAGFLEMDKNRDTFRLCLDKANISLSTWSPDKESSILEVYLSDTTSYDLEDARRHFESFRPLVEVAGIDIDKFYDLFVEGKHACLETPVKLWK